MRAEIKMHGDAIEYATDERCHILEVANDDGDERVSIARARVEPGITTAWHKLDGIAERYLIIRGSGRVEIGDLAPVDVGPGDVVRIPDGCRQRICNTGAGDLVFYAICSPPFRRQAYINLELPAPRGTGTRKARR